MPRRRRSARLAAASSTPAPEPPPHPRPPSEQEANAQEANEKRSSPLKKKGKVDASPSESMRQQAAATCACPVCLSEPCRPPIWQCQQGHVICSACFPKLPVQQCSICKLPMSDNPARCRLAEKILTEQKVPIQCPECEEMVEYGSFEEHSKACSMIQCPECSMMVSDICDHMANVCCCDTDKTRELIFGNRMTLADGTEKEYKVDEFLRDLFNFSYIGPYSDCATASATRTWRNAIEGLPDRRFDISKEFREFPFDMTTDEHGQLRVSPSMQYGLKNGFLFPYQDTTSLMPNDQPWPPILLRFFYVKSPHSYHIAYTITVLCSAKTREYMMNDGELQHLHFRSELYLCPANHGATRMEGVTEKCVVRRQDLFDSSKVHYFDSWMPASNYRNDRPLRNGYTFKFRLCHSLGDALKSGLVFTATGRRALYEE